MTTYMIVTGLVYNILLRGIELPQGSEPIPWSNETLHVDRADLPPRWISSSDHSAGS